MRVPSSSRAAAVAWTVWALMFLVALGAVALNGRNIPFAEDWGLVAPLTGHEPDLLAWLWAQNSEHRLPVPRLVGLTLLTLTRDYRAGMVLNVSVMAAVALGMMLVARGLRGGVTSYADAFFPLMFLHLGHWDNIVWSWQMQFVLATAFTCVLLLVITVQGREVGTGASLAAGLALIALPLSGATGLVFVPPLALWMALTGYDQWRTSTAAGPARWCGIVLLGSAIVAMLWVAFYFVGWQRPPWNPPSPSLKASLSFAARFTAFGLGPAASLSWRLSELLAFLILLATGVVAVAAVARGERSERLRTLGLLLFVAGAVVLALAIGSGRAGRGRMSPRYALLGVPVFCLAYFIWEIYGPPAFRRAARTGFLLVAVVALPLNTRAGLQRQEWFGQGFRALERDLAANAPSATLAERHHVFLQQDRATLASKMEMLERAAFGPFARARNATDTRGDSR